MFSSYFTSKGILDWPDINVVSVHSTNRFLYSNKEVSQSRPTSAAFYPRVFNSHTLRVRLMTWHGNYDNVHQSKVTSLGVVTLEEEKLWTLHVIMCDILPKAIVCCDRDPSPHHPPPQTTDRKP